MSQTRCSCGCEQELRLENGEKVAVTRLKETLLEFQAMGMPANEMVAQMLAERVRPVRPLSAAERVLFKAALLKEYARVAPAPRACACESCDAPQQPEAALGIPEPAAEVEVYSKANCPYTRALRRKLEHDKTPFVEYDVEADRDRLRIMLELNGGQRSVPTVRQNGSVTVGFHGH
ncbi:MAG TPA: Uxx-star family glutaredoxin-like (seleno)protein [Anaerolineae bacterium]|nr:Uxx-star family glutaredoxin-like (seleno)protein [Anaerolineae bacterium]HQJ52055.1 Uxx-star family glutaredoxin-like (seleno)protein [Anaerolineae bacterium]